jgi:hypothetical protein
MTITRGNPQKNDQLINEFGLDYAEDVLEISDPTSGTTKTLHASRDEPPC